MRIEFLLIVLSIIFSVDAIPSTSIQTSEDVKSERDEKLIFAFIQLTNEQCTIEGNNQFPYGTCITQKECKSRGGTAAGTCANGFAVCCYYTKTGGETANQNNTHFVNPSYPQSEISPGSNVLTVKKINKNICQVRLDFIDFNLSQPDDDGKCTTDFMTVSGSTVTLCGENTGQHMYVHVDPNVDDFSVRILSTDITLSKVWNIKIAQIECDSSFRAPSNCLQYYTDVTAAVKSFNFGLLNPNQNTRQISNLNYAICVDAPTGYCKIEWFLDSTANDPIKGKYGFTLSELSDSFGPDVLGTIDAGKQGDVCTTDFVMIPMGTYNVANPGGGTPAEIETSSDRFCGNGFPKSVKSSIRPFVMYAVTNNDEVGDTQNSGFSLRYVLRGC